MSFSKCIYIIIASLTITSMPYDLVLLTFDDIVLRCKILTTRLLEIIITPIIYVLMTRSLSLTIILYQWHKSWPWTSDPNPKNNDPKPNTNPNPIQMAPIRTMDQRPWPWNTVLTFNWYIKMFGLKHAVTSEVQSFIFKDHHRTKTSTQRPFSEANLHFKC